MPANTNNEKIQESINKNLVISLAEVLEKATDKKISVSSSPKSNFESKQLKQLLSENFIIVPVTVKGDSNLEIEEVFALSPSTTAYLADLLMMGDGTAAYESSQHLDAIKELFNQTLGSVTSAVKSENEISLEFTNVDSLEVGLDAPIWGKIPWSSYLLNIQDTESEEVKNLLHLISKPATTSEIAEDDKPQIEKSVSRKGKTLGRDISMLVDISLPIVIELGRAEMLMGDILEIGPGSVIELDKTSGDYVDVYVNDKKFAKGEVVVVDENFGVRIMELISAEDRLKKLK